MKIIEVVAAIILQENRILCVQRGAGKFDYISYKYEFPGGKVEPGESRESALTREIQEELNLAITVQEAYLTVDHSYPDFHITMHSFICRSETTDITLTEHINHQWLTKNELHGLDWAAADIPIVEKLMLQSHAD